MGFLLGFYVMRSCHHDEHGRGRGRADTRMEKLGAFAPWYLAQVTSHGLDSFGPSLAPLREIFQRQFYPTWEEVYWYLAHWPSAGDAGCQFLSGTI